MPSSAPRITPAKTSRILRVLPDMTVLAPCDAVECALRCAPRLQHDGPVYMRIGKKGEPVVHKPAARLRDRPRDDACAKARDVCLIGTGNDRAGRAGAPPTCSHAQGISRRRARASPRSSRWIRACLRRRVRDVSGRRDHRGAQPRRRPGRRGRRMACGAADRSARACSAFGTDDVFLHEIGSQDYARAQVRT